MSLFDPCPKPFSFEVPNVLYGEAAFIAALKRDRSRGKSMREIADRLGLGRPTVESWLKDPPPTRATIGVKEAAFVVYGIPTSGWAPPSPEKPKPTGRVRPRQPGSGKFAKVAQAVKHDATKANNEERTE